VAALLSFIFARIVKYVRKKRERQVYFPFAFCNLSYKKKGRETGTGKREGIYIIKFVIALVIFLCRGFSE